jgi:hypothetical protein
MKLEADEAPKAKRESTAWDYHRSLGSKDEWLTPRYITDALGPFDLDPCSPVKRPWPTAALHYTIEDNGLRKQWQGRVWCNPPYSTVGSWIARCAAHGNAIALIFARTETEMFFAHVWRQAHAIAFIRRRLTFLKVDGSKPKFTGGAPSCIIAWGEDNAMRLGAAIAVKEIDAHFVEL